MTTHAARLHNDIDNIGEMVKDDIDAALWHYGTDKAQALAEMESALANLQTAIALIKSAAPSGFASVLQQYADDCEASKSE